MDKTEIPSKRIALAMIVKGDDAEADLLARCLTATAPWVSGIFITVTHKPGEEPNKRTVQVAEMYGAKVSHFEWINDFGKARNFNFSQVTKDFDYIFWLDADDVPRNVESLIETVSSRPDVDVFSMFYLYAFDQWKNPTVVHHKTRVIKNDGCVQWSGKIHEDFSENRSVNRFHIDGIEILHLTDGERIKASMERNLEISKEELERDPNDPRSFWNLANSLKGSSKHDEALEAYDKFISLTKSEEEKYLAHLRKAETFWIIKKNAEAIDEARYAIGIRPDYPDAYHLLGTIYFNLKQYEKARDMYQMGLVKKPPQYSIIVYNPRDYDYVPLMNLAKAYFSLSFPTLALVCLKACKKIYPKDENLKKLIRIMTKEANSFKAVVKIVQKLEKIEDNDKLAHEMSKIPKAYQDHPAVCKLRNTRFIKQTSSGKDLSIYCGFTEELWTPKTAKEKGIGGSEEAVIWLSKLLTKNGWNVTVYNNCGYKELEFEGVKFKPFWSWNYRDKQDVTILWRTPVALEYEINCPKVFIDLHDTIVPGEFTEKRLSRITKIFVKSKFHRELYPLIPDEKFVIIPNGIDSTLFSETIEKDPYLMVNTSAPDRSASVLAEVFKKIKDKVPEAKLVWAYGWKTFEIVNNDDLKIMEWKKNVQEKLKDAGVVELGRISHTEVAELYKKAKIFLYPTSFAEIDCISASKAMASGAIPITTDFGALGEKKDHGGYFFPSVVTKDNWVQNYQFDFALKDQKTIDDIANKAIEVLQRNEDTTDMRNYALETFDWEKVVSAWNDELNK